MADKVKCPVEGCNSTFKNRPAMLGHIRFSLDVSHIKYKQLHPERKSEIKEAIPMAEVVNTDVLLSTGEDDSIVSNLEHSLDGMRKAISGGKLKGSRLHFIENMAEMINSALENNRLLSDNEIRIFKTTGYQQGADSRSNEVNSLVFQIQGRDQAINNLNMVIQDREKVIGQMDSALKDVINKSGALYQDNVNLFGENAELRKYHNDSSTNSQNEAFNEETRQELFGIANIVKQNQDRSDEILSQDKRVLSEIKKELEIFNLRKSDVKDLKLEHLKERENNTIKRTRDRFNFNVKRVFLASK